MMAASSSSYRGDSPSKKMARACFYLAASRQAKRFREGPHIVLPSRDAGDVAALLALGAKPSGIIAVDKDPQACLDVLDQYPGVKAINDDVFNVLPDYARKLSTVLLDFCGHLRRSMVDNIIDNLAKAPDGTIWGITTMYGREKSGAKSFFDEIADSVVDWVGSISPRVLANVADGVGIPLRVTAEETRTELQEMLKKKYENKEEGDPFDWRFNVIRNYFSIRAHQRNQPRPCSIYMRAPIRYVSKTEFSKGSPMMMLVGTVLRQCVGESAFLFDERRFAATEMTITDSGLHFNDNEAEFRYWIVKYYETFRESTTSHARVAQLLNIPVELLNMWVGEQP